MLTSLAFAGPADAQAPPPVLQPGPVPSVRILKGALVSPDQAMTVFGAATTHTPPIAERAPELKDLARALSRPNSAAGPARVGDLDLIYGYVRNRIDTEFLFGSHKGALGAVIDQSGTAFDQAALMVELAKESGFDAKYALGKVTLNQSDFAAWTGVRKAQAACDFFATAGIPAEFSTCSNTESFTVTFLHAWVIVKVGNVDYFFDPSLKPYEHRTGIDVRSAMGLTAGAVTTTGQPAASGYQDVAVDAGGTRRFDHWSNFNQEGVQTQLQGYTSALLGVLQGPALNGAAMVDVVGGPVLTPATQPTGGWRQTQPTNYTLLATWTEIPDQFRAKLTVQVDRAVGIPQSSWATDITANLYADDIYGRRLQLQAKQVWIPRPPATQLYRPYIYYPQLVLDPVRQMPDGTKGIQLGLGAQSFSDPALVWVRVRLTVDHPFAGKADAASAWGTFGDEVVDKRVNFIQPATIVHGWGHTSSRLGAQWAREQDKDELALVTQSTIAPTPDVPSAPNPGPSGDLTRAKAGAAWLAEFSRAAELHARLAGGRAIHHHTLGVVSGDFAPYERNNIDPDTGNGDAGFAIVDEVTVVDLQSDFGLVSYESDAAKRRGAVLAIAGTAAALEGIVLEETTDAVDAPTTARRLAWANRPECLPGVRQCDTPDTAPRKVFTFPVDTTTAADALTNQIRQTVVVENLASGARPVFQDQDAIAAHDIGTYRERLATAVATYMRAGFQVTASAEALLGPGHRHGPEMVSDTLTFVNWFFGNGLKTSVDLYMRMPTLQAGGALIATKYQDGEPVEIAHVLTRFTGESKGGGGPATTQTQAYDPKKAAEILKDRFVDRSGAQGVDLRKGTAGFRSGVLDSVGQGEFPYRLESSVAMRGDGPVELMGSCLLTNDSRCGLVTNWMGSAQLSSSPLEGMGQSRPEAAAATLAAFAAMQDIWSAAPSASRDVIGTLATDWWGRQLLANVVTVQQGADTSQFVKTPDGQAAQTFIPTGGGASRVIVTGGRVKRRPEVIRLAPNERQREAVVRTWKYDGVSFVVRGEGRDERAYAYWSVPDAGSARTPDSVKWGHRLAAWTFPRGVTLTPTYSALPTTYPQAANGYYVGPTAITSTASPSLTVPVPGLPTEAPGEVIFSATDALGGQSRAVYDVAGSGLARPVGPPRLKAIYSPESAAVARVAYTYTSTGVVAEARDANQVSNTALPPHRFFVADEYRGEREDPLGRRYAVEWLPSGGLTVGVAKTLGYTRHIDEQGFIVASLSDGWGRVLERTFPEGDKSQFEYDLLGNVVTLRRVPKPSSAEAPQRLTVSATWNPVWNKPDTITDARGGVTRFFYVAPGGGSGSGAGELARVERAAVSGGTPTYLFTYNGLGQLETATDPSGLVTSNAYDANHYLWKTTVNPNGLSLTTTFTNSPKGDSVDIDGPRSVADVSHVTYDALRRKQLEIAPDVGDGKPTATRTTYENDRVKTVEKGFMLPGGFQSRITTTFEYDAAGNKLKESSPPVVTQYSYDLLNRVLCTARRNTGAQPDACTPGTVGVAGPDQITRNFYDEAGKLTQVKMGVGSMGDWTLGIPFVKYEYSFNGQRTAVIDGVGNRTTLVYDGFDRLVTQYFPVKERGTGGYDPNDHEDYRYDANGNRIYLRKRDGVEFNFTFDANDRMTAKAVVGRPALDVDYSYDLAGRIASSLFHATSQGVVYGYDNARRVTSEATFGRVVGFELDEAGNRTRLTWPGGTQSVEYAYDPAGRPERIREPGATSGLGLLARYHYDELGRRDYMLRGNGGRADYTYDTIGRLESLTQAGGISQPVSAQTIAYTPVSQISSLTQTNLNYVWTGRPAYGNDTFNGLNQISRFKSLEGYDLNGNLTKTDQRTYAYDAENRLTDVGGAGGGLTLSYDPTGRLASTKTGAGTWTYFLYAGDELIGEYGSASPNAPPVRRHVHAVDTDDPILTYEDLQPAPRRWLHADRQGSIIGVSDEGGVVTPYAYGPWGEPSDWAGPRFRYTGQAALQEVQLYHYKARAYDPALGRFLQTDPIGQKDDPNIYAYVQGDPANKNDPDGEEAYCVNFGTCFGKRGDPETAKREGRAGKALAAVAVVSSAAIICNSAPSICAKFAQSTIAGGSINAIVAKISGKSNEEVRKAAVDGTISSAATTTTALLTGGASKAGTAIAVGSTAAAVANMQGAGDEVSAVAGIAAGAVEFVLQNPTMANSAALGVQGVLGDTIKAFTKKIPTTAAKEGAKAGCHAERKETC